MNYSGLIGIPFKETGDDRWGINCYNLLRAAYRLHEKKIPETDIAVCACRQISNNEIKSHILRYWQRIDRPEEPCGVLILSSDPGFANHIGTYVGYGKMLHVTKNTKSVIERISPKFDRKLLGYYKYIGV